MKKLLLRAKLLLKFQKNKLGLSKTIDKRDTRGYYMFRVSVQDDDFLFVSTGHVHTMAIKINGEL